MKSLVVFLLISAVRGTIVSYNVPTLTHTIPAAVSHQSRIDVHSSPSIITPLASHWTPLSHGWTPAISSHAWTPAISSHSWAPGIWSGHQGLGHLLRKRSLLLSAPIATVAHTVVSPAVSHQSRYDITTTAGHQLVHSGVLAAPIGHGIGHSWASPLGHSWASPVGHSWAPTLGHSWGLGHLLKRRSIVSPIIAHSPIITHSSIIPGVTSTSSYDITTTSGHIPVAHSLWTNPIGILGHGHLLKKRSLVAPLIGHSLIYTPIVGHTSSISKQSVDIVHPSPILTHSAPIITHSAPIITHSVPVLSHSASILAPVSHWSSPWAQSGLGHLGHW